MPDFLADKFMAILKRQVPDEEKRRRADFVIDTVSVLKFQFYLLKFANLHCQ